MNIPYVRKYPNELIIVRPENMGFKEFKKKRAKSNNALRLYLKGDLIPFG